jgi:hypothetical protein
MLSHGLFTHASHAPSSKLDALARFVNPRYALPEEAIIKWSRGESNPRPNKDSTSFLHVYPAIFVRPQADHGQPTLRLSPVRFAPGVGPTLN